MTCWSLPSARPIAFNDCPAFQRLHISARWAEESFHRLACIMDTTFRGETYIRWCCIDQLTGTRFRKLAPTDAEFPKIPFSQERSAKNLPLAPLGNLELSCKPLAQRNLQ